MGIDYKNCLRMMFDMKISMKRLSIVAACCLMLAGCQTMQQQPQKSQAQIEQERVGAKVRTAAAEYKACNDTVKATGILKRLFEEILYEDDKAANKFILMTNDDLPSKEQTEYLKLIIPEFAKCRSYVIDGYATTPFQNVVIKYFNGVDEIYIRLIKAEITIGKANEERAKIFAQQRADWSHATTEMDNRLRAMHDSEMTGRRQAAAAMLPYLMQQQQNQQFQQQMLYQQQMQNIMNSRPIMTAPTTTNCSTFGNQINCTTR